MGKTIYLIDKNRKVLEKIMERYNLTQYNQAIELLIKNSLYAEQKYGKN